MRRCSHGYDERASTITPSTPERRERRATRARRVRYANVVESADVAEGGITIGNTQRLRQPSARLQRFTRAYDEETPSVLAKTLNVAGMSRKAARFTAQTSRGAGEKRAGMSSQVQERTVVGPDAAAAARVAQVIRGIRTSRRAAGAHVG